jgi:hypothetical protein
MCSMKTMPTTSRKGGEKWGALAYISDLLSPRFYCKWESRGVYYV